MSNSEQKPPEIIWGEDIVIGNARAIEKLTQKDKYASMAAHIKTNIPSFEECEKNAMERDLANVTNIRYWHPKLAGFFNMPETFFFDLPFSAKWFLCGDNPEGGKEAALQVVSEMKNLFDTLVGTSGESMFMKSGLFSGKHYWKETCLIKTSEDIYQNLARLVEMQEMFGCEESHNIVLRRFIKTDPAFYAFDGKMPVTKERRYFTKNGQVEFHHPYWPPNSIKQPSCEDWQYKLGLINYESSEEIEYLSFNTKRVVEILDDGRDWCVDWLCDSDGKWWLIDMAEAHKAYRWYEYKLNKG